jgi:hypothetical protein
MIVEVDFSKIRADKEFSNLKSMYFENIQTILDNGVISFNDFINRCLACVSEDSEVFLENNLLILYLARCYVVLLAIKADEYLHISSANDTKLKVVSIYANCIIPSIHLYDLCMRYEKEKEAIFENNKLFIEGTFPDVITKLGTYLVNSTKNGSLATSEIDRRDCIVDMLIMYILNIVSIKHLLGDRCFIHDSGINKVIWYTIPMLISPFFKDLINPEDLN